jgi:Flp pilus assembly protein TadG
MTTGTARPDQRGVVAGTDVLLFGTVVLVGLILLFAQLWRVYEAEAAARAGAREAARTYVESDGDDPGRAMDSGAAALAQLGAPDGSVVLSTPGGFRRCQVVVAEATVVVPPVRLPFVGGVLGHTATARHVERIDPFRSGLDGDAGACDGP